MWKPNIATPFQFAQFLCKLTFPHYLLACGIYLLAFFYPGQNALQTIHIKPGLVKSYHLTTRDLSLYPQNDGVKVPYVTARGVVVQDLASKTILFARGVDTLMLPASTTKIMTAIVAREAWPDLDTIITVQNEDRAIGQTIDLVKGEELKLHDMLKGLLIHSGNDAALALADNYPGGYTAFVAAMNAKAASLHLDHTTYRNPSGIEQYGHVTTPRDLAILAGVAMSDPVISEIVSTKSTTISDVTGEILHPLESTNELLGIVPGLKGLKTGWTTNAGECLVSYIERDGKRIVVVVLGSSDRFGETIELVDWVYSHHNWIVPTI